VAERIQWGILGNATIARVCVIPAIQNSRNGAVWALGTRSPSLAEEVAGRNRIARVYDSYQAVLADPEVHAVYIPLPNQLHHPWALRALGAGKHVLCEKPLACTAREAEEMAAAARAAGLLLMEALMYRFHPRSRRIWEMVTEGAIGTPRLVRSTFCYPMAEEVLRKGENFRLRPETGGGALLDVGCYSVSVSRWLLGGEPTQVQAQAVYRGTGVDLHLVGTLRFRGEALAVVEASFISALQQTYTVVGSEAAIELPHNAFIPWEKAATFTMRGKSEEAGREQVIPGVDEYRLMVEHFADAVSGKDALVVSPEESVRTMRVLDALAEAARTGRTVPVGNKSCILSS